MRGNIEHSQRLQRVLTILQLNTRGITTLELNDQARTTRASSDVSELRQPPNNYLIDAEYIGKDEHTGARIWRYILRGRAGTNIPGTPIQQVRAA